MDGADQTLDLKHEPAEIEGEPEFRIKARDPGAIEFGLLYAAWKESKWELFFLHANRLQDLRQNILFHPIKDPESARAVRERVNQIRVWRAVNIPGETAVKAAPTVFKAPMGEVESALPLVLRKDGTYTPMGLNDGGPPGHEAALNTVRNARPPAEPDEGQ